MFEQLHIHSFRTLTDNWVLDLRGKLEGKLLALSQFMSYYFIENDRTLEAVKYLGLAVELQQENEEMLKRIGDLYFKCSSMDERVT